VRDQTFIRGIVAEEKRDQWRHCPREATNRGSMWQLDQNLDHAMDEEAGRLRNMYRGKGLSFLFS
jgi:hypothetical protein